MKLSGLLRKKGYLVALATLVILLALFVRMVSSAGMFVTIAPHFDGSCETVYGLSGAEDITIDQETGYAYISADDRRAWASGLNKPGAIFGLDLRDADSVPVNLTASHTPAFHPHGISLYRDTGGKKRLFVINHAQPGRHQVDIFSIPAREALQYLESISYEGLRSPNDLAAVGERQFYVTNDHYYPPGPMRLLEDFLGIPLSNVSFFDGTRGQPVAGGFRYANGITVSPDGLRVYVAETTGRSLVVLEREATTGQLARRVRIAVGTGADNLEWEADGRLLLTGHPRLFDFLAHAQSSDALSPSQVLRLNVQDSNSTPEEIYLNAGEQISAASVAARFGNTLLIGAVFDNKLLRCSYPESIDPSPGLSGYH